MYTVSFETMLLMLVMVFVLPALTFFATRYWTRRSESVAREQRRQDETEKNEIARKLADGLVAGQISELQRQLSQVGMAVQPLNAAYQAMLIKQLTHFHTPVLDALLVKLGPPVTLNEAEAQRLVIELEARTRDMGPEINKSEREAAMMLPFVMNRVREEDNMNLDNGKLLVVVVPPAIEEKPK